MRFVKVSKEIKKLNDSDKELATALLDKCEFLEIEITKLQKIIASNGAVEEYQNGQNQTGRKASAEVNTLLNMQKIYNSTIKQIYDIIKNANVMEKDELADFLATRPK